MADQRLPSRAGIARYLREQGLCRSYEKHQPLPQSAVVQASQPHIAWEMDARGHDRVPGVGVVSLIDVSDRYSRAKLNSHPCLLGEQRLERHPDTSDYRAAMRVTATEWGLPDELHLDRDSVFHENTNSSPFPTGLHLWLLALGVNVVLGPPRQPRKRAIVERSHQTWEQQVLRGQSFSGLGHLQECLREARDFLNWRMPIAALGGKPPLEAYPGACQPRRPYSPAREEELMDLSRVYDYLSQGRWYRRASNTATVSLGNKIYCLGSQWKRAQVEITFDPTDQHLVFRLPGKDGVVRRPIQGITKADLAGTVSDCLPVTRHSETPGDTT